MSEEDCNSLKSTKKKIMTTGKVFIMSCKTDVWAVASVRPMMFYGTCKQTPECISCADTVIFPKEGFQINWKF